MVVAPGPGGLTIASEDQGALDALESLLNAIAGQSQAAGPRLHIFDPKHISASAASTLLSSVMSGMATSSPAVSNSRGGGGRSRGDDSPRGVIGSLLQGGGSGGSVLGNTTPYIVADSRLNSLFVQGTPAQIKFIEEMLKIVDQESGPEEVMTFPKPKFIPVYYTSAQSVAEVLRQVYANRIATDQSNQRRGGGPSPEDFIPYARRRSGRLLRPRPAADDAEH